MRKKLAILTVICLLLCLNIRWAYANSGFSLINGNYTKDIETGTTDYPDFWRNLRIDFVQSSTDPDLYEGFGESSATDSNPSGLDVHTINGSITATYNVQTGILQGEYEIVHVITIVPKNEYQAEQNGTITSFYSGTFENTLSPGDKSVTIHAAGIWVQSVTGNPYGREPDPGESYNFTSRWEFPVEYQIEGEIPGRSCNPEVMGLDGLVPGDTLSPSATYFDAQGNEVEIIQERWLINGVNTPSVDWDGQATTLELQWTCLDNKGYSKTFMIPAYVYPAVPSAGEDQPPGDQYSENQSPQEKPTQNGLTPGVFAAIWAGAAGLLTGVGFLINHLINGKKPVSIPPSAIPPIPPLSTPPPPSQPPLGAYNPADSILPSSIATATPNPPPISNQPSFPPSNQPSGGTGRTGLTPIEAQQITNIRNEMIQERDRIKDQWRKTRDAVEKLKKLKKKNMLKFITKQGFETYDWIMNSPVEVINKISLDPVMDEVFQKHDTSQDSKIIISIHNRILSLQAEMNDLVNQSKYLNQEISKLDSKLAKSIRQ